MFRPAKNSVSLVKLPFMVPGCEVPMLTRMAGW